MPALSVLKPLHAMQHSRESSLESRPSLSGRDSSYRTSSGRDMSQHSVSSSSSPLQRQAHACLEFREKPAHIPEDSTCSQAREGPGSRTTTTTQVCTCKSDQKIPRPKNAFFLYRQHFSSTILAKNPHIPAPEISKIVGKQWNNEPPEVQNEWKRLAEEEKARHQQQHPEYKYQPRRGGRRSSEADNGSSSKPGFCNRCGGKKVLTPTSPKSPMGQWPPPPISPPQTIDPSGRQLPSISQLTLTSPQFRRDERRHPASIEVFPPSQFYHHYPDERDMTGPLSADSKRRRMTGGGYLPIVTRPSAEPVYPLESPRYRGSMSGPAAQRLPQPIPAPVSARNHPSVTTLPRPQDLRPDPTQPTGAKDLKQNTEAMVMGIWFLRKIAILSSIAPPLRPIQGDSAEPKERGALIAVEGDDQNAVNKLVDWLNEYLRKDGEYAVRVGQGPRSPTDEKEPSMDDYFDLIREWRDKSKEIVDFMTNTQKNTDSTSEEETLNAASKTPVVILERFQLYASNAYAVCIPREDNYGPGDHWQWMATLWRGIVGPDVTIYVRDAPADEIEKERAVQLVDDARCIIFRREEKQPAGETRFDEKNLRRLGFEVSEAIRCVGQARKENV